VTVVVLGVTLPVVGSVRVPDVGTSKTAEALARRARALVMA
jgi:hypothetical protein